jgi:hypothetical protein
MKKATIVDRAFWLGKEDDPTDPINAWALAVEAIDQRGDKSPLMKLLRSADPLPPEGRAFIADLLDRHELKKKTLGRPRLPIYDRSLIEAVLLIGIQRIQEYREKGMDIENAVHFAAKEFALEPKKLLDAYIGKRGASRRRIKAAK